jgi:hypothetical protein
MPHLDVLSVEQAQLNSATGKRAQTLREYISIIERVPHGQAGRLSPEPGETLGAVQRRLNAAAKTTDQTLTIKRTDEHVYFWGDSNSRGRRPAKKTS